MRENHHCKPCSIPTCMHSYLLINNREQTPNVQHGFFNSWVDYNYPAIWRKYIPKSSWIFMFNQVPPERRVTLSTVQAELITGLAILILALSIPSAYLVLVRITAKTCATLVSACVGRKPTINSPSDGTTTTLHENQDTEAHEQTPLLDHHQEEGLWPRIYCIWTTSTSPQSSVTGFMAVASYQEKSRNKRSSWKHYGGYAGRIFLSIIFSLLAIAVFFTLAFSTILSANIVTDSTVLSNHPDCGVWIRNSTILTPSPTGYDYLEEVEAAEYSKKCYHGSQGNDGCNAFLTQRIPYSSNSHCECPFEDSLCLDGRFSAYTLDTGTISSKSLGINMKIGYSFKRTTTCSPIQRRGSLSADKKTYEYEYGSSSEFGNLSWISPANPEWEFAGYNVKLVTVFSLILCFGPGMGMGMVTLAI
jgi:hypothetical protein